MGEDRSTTIIDGSLINTSIVNIYADSVKLCGFTTRNSTKCGFYSGGIDIWKSDNNSVTDNIVISNNAGIVMHWGKNNTIEGNIIASNKYEGILLRYNCIDNTIANNTITLNFDGISINRGSYNLVNGNSIYSNKHWGINIFSEYNTMSYNKISNNIIGIFVYAFGRNVVIYNHIISNKIIGINLKETYLNTVKYNNIIGNRINAFFWYYSEPFTIDGWDVFFLNYWGRPRLLPKIIFGIRTKTHEMPPITYSMPWIYIDWRPALIPYNIEV